MKMISQTLILALASMSLTQAESERDYSTPFRSCHGENMRGHMTRLWIPGCHRVPCIMRIGSTYNVNVDFSSEVDFARGRAEMFGYLVKFDQSVPFLPFSLKDTCGHMSCPVTAGTNMTFVQPLPISPSFPRLLVIAKWKLFSERGDLIVCYTVPIKIMD